MTDETWLELMLRRGEELARRLVITPTPPLTAAVAALSHTQRSSSGALGEVGSLALPGLPGVGPLFEVTTPGLRQFSITSGSAPG